MNRPPKAISHGINYGRGPTALAQQMIATPGRFFGQCYDDVYDEVRQMWQSYFDMFPGIQQWLDEIRGRCSQGGTVDNGFGRPIRTRPDKAHTEAPGRQAQSCARDLAMEGLFRLEDAGLWPAVRMFLHDEVVLTIPAEQAESTARTVADLMSFEWTSPSGLIVPIIAEPCPHCGPMWADCYRETPRSA